MHYHLAAGWRRLEGADRVSSFRSHASIRSLSALQANAGAEGQPHCQDCCPHRRRGRRRACVPRGNAIFAPHVDPPLIFAPRSGCTPFAAAHSAHTRRLLRVRGSSTKAGSVPRRTSQECTSCAAAASGILTDAMQGAACACDGPNERRVRLSPVCTANSGGACDVLARAFYQCLLLFATFTICHVHVGCTISRLCNESRLPDAHLSK